METAILLLTKYGYFILFPLAAFEGPIISLIAGFLVHLGYFSFLPVLIILVLGDVIPDVIYYYIGRFGSKRKIIEKYGSHLNLLEKLWREHGKKTMFFSKIAYGLSTPLLISAGLVKMPIRRFVSYTIPISITLYTVIITSGYYLGNSYQLAAKYINFAEIIIAVIFVIFIAVYVFSAKYARRQIEKMKREQL
ncbi:MAG: VTT domain-containing protein [Patescibacteria group bacterium]